MPYSSRSHNSNSNRPSASTRTKTAGARTKSARPARHAHSSSHRSNESETHQRPRRTPQSKNSKRHLGFLERLGVVQRLTSRSTSAHQSEQNEILIEHSATLGRQISPLRRTFPLIFTVVVLIALLILALSCSTNATKDQTSGAADKTAASMLANAGEGSGTAGALGTRVSFVAVGDNLPDQVIGNYADGQAGSIGDGVYDYTSIYANVKPYIEAADIAYVKEETHIGGNDIGPRGWPSFNTTDEMAPALVDAGFDLVASASNHSYDWGYFGALEHSCDVWREQPVIFSGTAASEEEAQTIPVLERNGITFSLLDYTYGVNGYTQDELPSYAVNFIDEERIRADVARAHEVSDVVMVAMHWGRENQTEPDDMQLQYAQLLADLDVDIVLGSHPHVIGPLAWVEGASGHQTLVAYSLGNFLSHHEAPQALNELEGMLSCDFVKTESGISIENVKWIPLVNHTETGFFGIYALKDYTADLAAAHPALAELDDPLTWLRDSSAEIVNSLGEAFEIDA